MTIGAASYALIPAGIYLAYVQRNSLKGIKPSFNSFLVYLLPERINVGSAAVYRSYRLDILFTTAKHFLNSWFLVPILISNVFTSRYIYQFLTQNFGERLSHSPKTIILVMMLIAYIMISDFIQFLIHYAHHHMHVLWGIHKVHHSTEFMLMPLSVKRTHILEEIINLTANSVVTGILIGSTSYLLSIDIWQTEFYGIDAWFLMHLASFWHLRHSHISLSYGWFEHIFQSPAQHQLHHSREVEHWDKNFGLLFSFWDKLFNCFLLSVPPATYRIGLNEPDAQDYDTVLKLFVSPFVKIYDAVKIRVGVRQPHDLASTDAVERHNRRWTDEFTAEAAMNQLRDDRAARDQNDLMKKAVPPLE